MSPGCGSAAKDQGRGGSSGCEGDGPEIWLIDLEACAGALGAIEAREGLLTPGDRQRLQAIKNEGVARERMCAVIALRVLMARVWGSACRGIEIARSAGVAPFLPGVAGSFSLSHAAGHALVGITVKGAVGVDLEGLREVMISPERRGLILEAAGHLPVLRALPAAGGDTQRFMSSWVRLEATAKMLGCGIGRLLTDLGIIGPRGGDLLEQLERVLARVPDLQVADIEERSNGLVGAVAVRGIGFCGRVLRFPDSVPDIEALRGAPIAVDRAGQSMRKGAP